MRNHHAKNNLLSPKRKTLLPAKHIARASPAPLKQWVLKIIIQRFDGIRIQHLKIPAEVAQKIANPSSTLKNAYSALTLQHNILEKTNETNDLCQHKTLLFDVMFDQPENELVLCEKPVPSDAHGFDVVVQIRLCDTRIRVKTLTILHSRTSELPKHRRDVFINNLCGKAFLPCKIDMQRLRPVSIQNRLDFGCIMEIFTFSSNICIKKDLQTVLIKGNSFRYNSLFVAMI
jgi:hypothetical protein